MIYTEAKLLRAGVFTILRHVVTSTDDGKLTLTGRLYEIQNLARTPVFLEAPSGGIFDGFIIQHVDPKMPRTLYESATFAYAATTYEQVLREYFHAETDPIHDAVVLERDREQRRKR